MYLLSITPVVPARRAQRMRAPMSLSGLGCNCRGGHYLTGLGDDSVQPTDPTLINLENNPAAGMPDVPVALPAGLSPTPVSLPFPDPTFNAPIATPVKPMVVPNVQAMVPTNVAAQLNVIPATSPVAPFAYQPTLPNPAPAQPKTSWLNQQTIKGVPNKYLIAGVAGIMVLAAAGKRR